MFHSGIDKQKHVYEFGCTFIKEKFGLLSKVYEFNNKIF